MLREVEKLAGLWRIRLRTGAFCNPGAAAAALRLSADDVRAHFETGGHTCWDDHDIIGANHLPGSKALHSSVGWPASEGNRVSCRQQSNYRCCARATSFVSIHIEMFPEATFLMHTSLRTQMGS